MKARILTLALSALAVFALAACETSTSPTLDDLEESQTAMAVPAAPPTPASTTDMSAPTPAVRATPPPPPTAMPEREGPKQWDAPPAMVIDTAKSYSAVFELEKGGEFTIELYADKVPNTVNNFVFLSREGYYDGVTFHRVIANFMAQFGDPTGTGRGGPGYRFADEFHPDLRHDSAGIVSMANAGPNTNGSQIFITFVPTPNLDGGHAVFGKVVSGMDVVNNITLRDPNAGGPPGDVVTRIRILEE